MRRRLADLLFRSLAGTAQAARLMVLAVAGGSSTGGVSASRLTPLPQKEKSDASDWHRISGDSTVLVCSVAATTNDGVS